MNKRLTAAVISLILILSLTFGVYVSSADEPAPDTGEIVTGEETGAQSDDPQPVTEEPADTTGEVTGEDTGIDTAEVTGEDTGEVTGEDTGEDTGEVTGEDTGEDTGEVTGEDTGEVTGEDTGEDTGETGTETDAPIVLTGIAFEQEVYRLHPGETVQAVVKPIPEDAELPKVAFFISDDIIAVVSSDGLVTAEENGKTVLTATTSDGAFICYCTIIVSSSDLSFITLPETGEKIVEGFKLGTTVKQAKADICTSEGLTADRVTIYNADRTEAADNISVSTGMIFVVDSVEYTAIIYGDVNGDGIINSGDTQTVSDYVTGKITLGRPFMLAADLKGDGSITIQNALMIQRHIYGYALIPQQKPAQ